MSPLPVTPALVWARVVHRRERPFPTASSHRTTMWLVDVAEPAAAIPGWLRPLIPVCRADQDITGDDRSLAVRLREHLVAHGLGWSPYRCLALVEHRPLNQVSEPPTTYFCFDRDGRLEGVVAEMHDADGQRCGYPFEAQPLAPGAAEVDRVREMRVRRLHANGDSDYYLSPFFALEGRYDLRTRLMDPHLSVAVSLIRGEESVFSTRVDGVLEPATVRRTLAAVAHGYVDVARLRLTRR